MSARTLDAKALESHLPHRGRNLLTESLTIAPDGRSSTSHTRLSLGDHRGRDVMLRRQAGGGQCWYEPFLAELMALTGVPLLHARLSPKNQVAVFSMISKIAFHGPAPVGHEVVGHAEITRERGEFVGFSTHAEVDGKRILEAEVMSGAAVLAEVGAKRGNSGCAPAGEPVDHKWFAWKAPALRFVDRIVKEDRGNGRLLAAYRYPDDHVFVPGHFPGQPVMMGVTQWAAAADAAWAAFHRFGLRGSVVANGTIRRPDGAEILDVRDLVLRDDGGIPTLVATKRLAFREPVLPGDELLIDVEVKPLPAA
jgi:3-hydroxymyristoyl/3-hydroxydecanoyl-(acyl carrier protein) dehydratase